MLTVKNITLKKKVYGKMKIYEDLAIKPIATK